MKVELEVCLGAEGTHIGDLVYSKEGHRESCQFKYTEAWLQAPESFALCPQLKKQAGHQSRSSKGNGSVFFDCFADTQPNGWGKKVILRDYAHQKNETGKGNLPSELTSVDFLLWVDDFTRQGALRFRDKNGVFCKDSPPERRKAPPVLSFEQLIASTRAIELNKDTKRDLEYLRGRGSDLDGMRPKCTIIDTNGDLCLAKFPSVGDTRSITMAEILAIQMSRASGIRTQQARMVNSDGVPVVLINRFDRVGLERRMYLSAGSMIDDFDGKEDHAYTEIADVIRQSGAYPERDIEELWRRMVFNILIKNVDDHLHNHGFLHVKKGKWELSPAFDINPFPEKQHVLKLWISEDSGISGEIGHAIEATKRFGISEVRAKEVMRDLLTGTSNWASQARKIGLSKFDVDALSEAFEHDQRRAAEVFSARKMFDVPDEIEKISYPVER